MLFWLRHLHPGYKGLIVFIFFAVAAFVIPIQTGATDRVASVLGATSIFYSILVGFYITSSMANLSRLKTLVANETGALIAIYYIVKLSLPDRLDSTREAIDRYIIKRFDYEVHDYTEPTTHEFFAIFDCLKGAEAKSEGEGAAMTYIGEAMYYIAQARREITIVGAKIVNNISSMLLYILSGIIVISLFYMRAGGFESSMVAVLLSTAAVLSLLILHDVDGNRFGEEEYAIGTYEDVLIAIGKKPYYSHKYLRSFRYKPNTKDYRTDRYPKRMHQG